MNAGPQYNRNDIDQKLVGLMRQYRQWAQQVKMFKAYMDPLSSADLMARWNYDQAGADHIKSAVGELKNIADGPTVFADRIAGFDS